MASSSHLNSCSRTFDTLAVGVLVSPGLVRCESDFSATIRHEPRQRNGLLRSRDRTTLEVSNKGGGRPIRWCLGPEAGFTEDLLRRLIRGGTLVDRQVPQHHEWVNTEEATANRYSTGYEVR